MQPLIQLRNSQVVIGGKCLLSIDCMDIAKSEKIAVVGPSGAGKSSLLNILYEQLRDEISWCPQELGLVPSLSVYHNIYMGQLNHYSWVYNLLNLLWPLPKRWLEISELALLLHLKPQLKQTVDSLSGGQKQRTALARAWYANKSIFIGDEPTSSLDTALAQQLVKKTVERFETVIIATHDLELALNQFDRVIVIKNGKIALDQATAELSVQHLTHTLRK